MTQITIDPATTLTSVKNLKWAKRVADHREVERVMRMCGVSDVIAEILLSKQISEAEMPGHLNPTLRSLMPSPSHLLDLDKGVEIVLSCIKNKQKIAVFGDYDVDGATSSALFAKFFDHVGAKYEVYIPDRVKDGYGPNKHAMEELHARGAHALITVDCGCTSHAAIDHAKSLGMEVVVIDHHVCDEVLPNADAIINPNRQDETSPYTYLCAAGVSFLFVAKLAQMHGATFDIIKHLDLVALGTVCDVMPMVGLNRAFVRHGLKLMEEAQNVGIAALKNVAKTQEPMSSYTVGFLLGPRINAGGRVGISHLGSQLLRSNCHEEASCIADELNLYNDQRKVIESVIVEEALLKAKRTQSEVLLVSGANWHVGVIGIVASRLVGEFYKPSAVIGIDGNGVGKGSARSIAGIDFGAAVLKAKRLGLLDAGGGHAMAAGFTVQESAIERFAAFLNEELGESIAKERKNRVMHFDADIAVHSPTVQLISQIERLGPFGPHNHEPKFRLMNASIVHAKILKQRHVQCVIKDIGSHSHPALKAIAFNAIDSVLGEVLLSASAPLDLVVSLELNHWNGGIFPRVKILDALIGDGN